MFVAHYFNELKGEQEVTVTLRTCPLSFAIIMSMDSSIKTCFVVTKQFKVISLNKMWKSSMHFQHKTSEFCTAHNMYMFHMIH